MGGKPPQPAPRAFALAFAFPSVIPVRESAFAVAFAFLSVIPVRESAVKPDEPTTMRAPSISQHYREMGGKPPQPAPRVFAVALAFPSVIPVRESAVLRPRSESIVFPPVGTARK
jgi:cobalamin synthase